MKEQIEVLRKAVVDLCAVIDRNGTHHEYSSAWRHVEQALTPEFLLSLIGPAEAQVEQQPAGKSNACPGEVSMRDQIEKLREVVLRVQALKVDGGDAYDLAWDEFDQIVRPDVMLAFIDRLHPELEPEPTFKSATAGFYALMYKESGEIVRIEYADDQLAAEVILHAHLRLEQKRLTIVEKVSVRRYANLGSPQ